MRVKNHHMPPMIRVDRALGISSEPGVGQGNSGMEIEGKKKTFYISICTFYIHINICDQVSLSKVLQPCN